MELTVICVIWSLAAASVQAGHKEKAAAVFGGGASGLTAAMQLREAGFKVDLYEKMGRLGGKMIGYVDKEGYAREHCLRILGSKYLAFGEVMHRIGLKTLKQFDIKTQHFVNLRFILNSKSGLADFSSELHNKMLEAGVRGKEMEYFVFQILTWLNISEVQRNSFFNVDFWKFIDGFAFDEWKVHSNCTVDMHTTKTETYCINRHSNSFHSSLKFYISTATANIHDTVPNIMRVMEYFLDNFLAHAPKQCLPYYKYSSSMYFISGPTSTVIIDPWVNYVKNISVKIHKNHALLKFNRNPFTDSITGALVRDKKGKLQLIKADVFIMALPVNAAEHVAPGITQGAYKSTLWSLGLALYLPCLPESWQLYRNASLMTATWDSPYNVAYTLQSPDDGAWKGSGVKFKNGIEYVISMVASNFEKPGSNGKAVLESSRNELLAELLTQIRFPKRVTCSSGYTYTHTSLIKTAKFGLHFHNVREEVYQQHKHTRYNTAKVGPLKTDGKRWILDTHLYKPTKDHSYISPMTKFTNLFLAGDYVASPLAPVISMEHVMGTGMLAAQAAIEAMGVMYTVPVSGMLLKLVNSTTVAEYDEKVKAGFIIGGC